MNDTPPDGSPGLDDPAWVDRILARARDRADRPEPAAVAPVARPAAAHIEHQAPTFALPVVNPNASVFIDGEGIDRGADGVQPARGEPEPDAESETRSKGSLRGWIEWIAVAFGAVLVALLIRAFVLQAFYIPSESMEPTLHENDRIMVNKLSYRLHDVRRGDLVVFRRPPNMASGEINDLIKRVIALPNETIELRGSDIYIDDQKLTEPYLTNGTPTLNLGWVTGCANPSTERNRCLIPPGHVFVMGDNRSHSSDGRVFGPIDEDLIVGRAFVRIWPPSKLDFL
ncbi:MAG TPA: signal peptidase I [Acidimicrobiales bacterium]|nr:signal peptidase I [Acidimicrobiales bacterium]